MTAGSLFDRRPATVFEAEGLVADVRLKLTERGVQHRPPPPVPTTCCGRGCNGCVWQGYFEALRHWQIDAGSLLG